MLCTISLGSFLTLLVSSSVCVSLITNAREREITNPGVVPPKDANPFPFDAGFDIAKVVALAQSLPSHSWEFGTAAEALLELYNSSLSVFSKHFHIRYENEGPDLDPNLDSTPSLKYARSKITLGGGDGRNALADGDGAVADPASLGVSAMLLGKYLHGAEGAAFAEGARLQLDFTANGAPRGPNGAISHRIEVIEFWSDFVYMAPPFMAYSAIITNDFELLKESVRQCGLYREILQKKSVAPTSGAWQHILGPRPQVTDTGLWSTGNAWAAAGMVRVAATIVNSNDRRYRFVSPGNSIMIWRHEAIKNLTQWIGEIVDAAISAPLDGGLLRNYIDDEVSAHGFGEVSGSALLTAVVYRMAVISPGRFGSKYLEWADTMRGSLARHVRPDGVLAPAVDPLGWKNTQPYTKGSPEGQAFAVLMYAAWRDCVWVGICQTR